MSITARPKTRKLSVAEKAAVAAAREAVKQGKSIKGIAFGLAQTPAAKAAYLKAHL